MGYCLRSKPYIDTAYAARQAGLLGVAAEVEQRAESVGCQVEEIAQAEERMKARLQEQQAFSRLCDETEEDVLTLTDFKISNPQAADHAWWQLIERLTESPPHR